MRGLEGGDCAGEGKGEKEGLFVDVDWNASKIFLTRAACLSRMCCGSRR